MEQSGGEITQNRGTRDDLEPLHSKPLLLHRGQIRRLNGVEKRSRLRGFSACYRCSRIPAGFLPKAEGRASCREIEGMIEPMPVKIDIRACERD